MTAEEKEFRKPSKRNKNIKSRKSVRAYRDPDESKSVRNSDRVNKYRNYEYSEDDAEEDTDA